LIWRSTDAPTARDRYRIDALFLPFLVVKNAFRHKLRTTLTVVGIVVAITAFGLLRTIVDAWYAGVNASSSARLVTRSAVSLVFPLPLTYAAKLRQVDGVASVTWANWFGGVYVSERNFFPQFAIDAPTYLDMYSEFVLSADEKKAFLTDRKGAIAGRKLAERYGWKSRRSGAAARHDLPRHLDVHVARYLLTVRSRPPINRRSFSTGRS
jgi:putative ABC transport system permease protein